MIKERLWEIDFFRGIAIILMIIFNYSFALLYLRIYVLNDGFLYWYVFPRFIGGMFIFLAGLSLTLMYSQIKNKKDSHKKFFSRGLKIFGYGLLITAITYLTFPEAFIIFGILHFIGISIILGSFFLKYNKLNLVLGLLIILFGFYLQSFSFNFSYLLWLGFTPQNFYTFDYWPILPWFGVTLLGIFFGNLLYKNGKRNFKIKDFSNSFVTRFLDFLGRNSLSIYLIHQPLLVIILLVLGFKIF
jgi:uncharacterized membrane protein